MKGREEPLAKLHLCDQAHQRCQMLNGGGAFERQLKAALIGPALIPGSDTCGRAAAARSRGANRLTAASRFTGGNNAGVKGFLMKAVGGVIGLIATFGKRCYNTEQGISLLAGENV